MRVLRSTLAIRIVVGVQFARVRVGGVLVCCFCACSRAAVEESEVTSEGVDDAEPRKTGIYMCVCECVCV